MFSNDFSEEELIGFFTPGHYIVMAVYLLLAFLLAYKLRKISSRTVKWIIFGIACFVSIAEFLKDFENLKTLEDVSSYLQLAYCSLFIPALFISFVKFKPIKLAGISYLLVGGLIGGIFYIISPNGSIDHYPIYHIKALHGLVFHFLMVFLSLLCLFTKTFVIEKKMFKYYFSFISFFTLIAVYLNYYHGCGALFLNNPCNIPVLEVIYDYNKVIFALIIYIGESIVAFWLVYFVYHFIVRLINKKTKVETIYE